MKKLVEMYRDKKQLVLLIPDGLVVVVINGKITIFAGMSEFINHPLASMIMTDEVIDVEF